MEESYLISSFITLKEVNENTNQLILPIGVGSAFIIEYCGRHFLISVLHNFKRAKAVLIEAKWNEVVHI